MACTGKLVLFVAILGAHATIVLGSQRQEKLLAELLAEYDPLTPPNEVWNDSLKVSFGISLNKIQKVSEAENSVTLMTWLKMEFVDYRLSWDPAVYDGIYKLRIPYDRIWIPDIVLYNGLSGSQFFEDKIMAVVKSTGEVTALPPMLVTASCDMDLALFPFDTQSCPLKFGSWTYDRSVIDLQAKSGEMDTSRYSPNPEWNLKNASMKLNLETYPCCPPEVYPDITATLEIERRSAPYSVKLVIPSVLTAFLILFTFILPSSSGEKIVFCLILLLTLVLLLVYLHVSVPSNTESVLGEFLTFALFLDFFATIITVVCYNIADALLMRDTFGGPESEKHWKARKRKLKILRIMEFVFFLLFLLIFIIGTAVILTRRG